MIFADPADRPVTIPDVPIVATDGDPELHVPPLVLLLNAADEPMHKVDEPFIIAGNPLMVIVAVTEQPVGNV